MDDGTTTPGESRTAVAKILVVDDAPQNVKLLRVILQDAGYHVVEASSGPQALDKLRGERPDLMVLDVRMPGMSGYEVCQRVRQDPVLAALPVIMVTALSLPEERIKGIQAGATDFITKPFIKKELLARIQASLAFTRASRHGGIMDALPGAVLILTPEWRTLALSPLAGALLGVSAADAGDFDFRTRLAQPGVWTSLPDPLTATETWTMRMPVTPGYPAIGGRHTLVGDASGRPLLRVITLAEGEP